MRLLRTRAVLPILAAVALLTGCSSSDTSSTADTEGNATSIVATTQVWADIAAAVTGEPVEAIITGTATDPHHFEPSAADLARLSEADIVVANGGGYDAKLYAAVDPSRVIHALPLVDADDHNHDHDHDHAPDSTFDIDDIEHAWFSPQKVTEIAREVESRAGGSAADVTQRMEDITERLAALPHIHLAQTEPIAAGLIYGSELHDITPEGYLRATLNHTEPPVEATATFLEILEAGHLDFLVYNPQSTNSATQRLVDAATERKVPIVEITETPPEGTDFLDYIEQVTAAIEQIASSAHPSLHDSDHDAAVPAA